MTPRWECHICKSLMNPKKTECKDCRHKRCMKGGCRHLTKQEPETWKCHKCKQKGIAIGTNACSCGHNKCVFCSAYLNQAPAESVTRSQPGPSPNLRVTESDRPASRPASGYGAENLVASFRELTTASEIQDSTLSYAPRDVDQYARLSPPGSPQPRQKRRRRELYPGENVFQTHQSTSRSNTPPLPFPLDRQAYEARDYTSPAYGAQTPGIQPPQSGELGYVDPSYRSQLPSQRTQPPPFTRETSPLIKSFLCTLCGRDLTLSHRCW